MAADLRLPLGGYYRPGRFMPVGFSGKGEDVELSAAGAVRLHIAGAQEGVAPWLIIGASGVTSPAISESTPLQALGPDEKLVGLAGVDVALPGDLFGDQMVVRETLDAVDPLPGAPVAWESLDAVAMSETAFGRLRADQFKTLVAGGTAVLVEAGNGDRAPPPNGAGVTWRRDGAWWRCDGMPSLSAGAGGAAFAPLEDWAPETSDQTRRQILVLGTGFTLVMLALVCGRRSWRWHAGACVACLAVTGVWQSRRPETESRQGTVWLEGASGGVGADDTWTYIRGLRPTTVELPWAGDIELPVPAREQDATAMRLDCDGQGNPLGYFCPLGRMESICLVSRTIQGQVTPDGVTWAVVTATVSPLRRLLPDVYPQCVVVGETPSGSPDVWPSLVVRLMALGPGQ